MQLKHAALAALLAGGAYVGVETLRGDRTEATDPAPPVVAEEAAADAPVAEAAAPTPPSADPAITEIETRLAEAETERDRLRAELDAAATERDALADALAAREAEAATPGPEVASGTAPDDAPEPAAEIERLLGDLAGQAAEIDRLKTELAARDAELATLRQTAKILPLAAAAPSPMLVAAPDAGAPVRRYRRRRELCRAARCRQVRTAAAPPGPGTQAVVSEPAPLALVLFERGSARLTAGGADRAAEAAAALAVLNPGRIRVTGHSDTTGSPDANMRLSQARAEAVAASLVAAGLPAERIEIAPHGQAPEALPIPTGVGVAEPLNRCAGIFVMAAAD